MMHHSFIVLAVLQFTFSLPVKETINPVDLKYSCVQVKAREDQIHEKIPVLLIHGLGGSHKAWDGINLLISFLTKRKVCSVDLRNHGDSPWNERTDVKAMTADIGRFLDNQGMKTVNIIGHSLGGKVAVHYTLNNPDRINSIVVEDWRPNGAVKDAYGKVVTFFEVLKEASTKIPAGVAEEKAIEIIVNSLNGKKDQVGAPEKFTKESISFLELKLDDGKWIFKHNMDVLLTAMKDPDVFLSNSTGVYTGPALFIYGDQSSFKVGEDKSNILRLFPRAKLVPVKGAGHIIHGVFREFEDEVVKFLNEAD